MAVPASLAALSTTADSNPPSGGENPFPELDNHLRFGYSCVAQLRDQKAPLASPTFTGIVTAPRFSIDSYSMYVSGGAAILNFDPNDYMQFVRATNVLETYIGGALALRVAATGPERSGDATTADGLVRKSQMDTADALRCLKTANLSDLADAATALANLGGISSSTFTGANQNLANPGRQNLPGGFQLRFGSFSNNGQAVTFDTDFPTTCFGVWMSSSAGAGVHVRLHPLNVTKSGFTVDSENVSNSSGRYIAIGW